LEAEEQGTKLEPDSADVAQLLNWIKNGPENGWMACVSAMLVFDAIIETLEMLNLHDWVELCK